MTVYDKKITKKVNLLGNRSLKRVIFLVFRFKRNNVKILEITNVKKCIYHGLIFAQIKNIPGNAHISIYR
jgi:hypothetical protein